MSEPWWITGDSLDVVRQLPDESIDLVVTSPPYLRKVSYLPPDHPEKERELGTEERPVDFIEALLTHADEWFRVLRPGGSIAIDLGDTFCADTETEILSRDGWKTWDSLAEGDEVLTLNPDSGLAEWQAVQRVNVFEPARRRMLRIEGRSMSALVTADHRWLVEQRIGTTASRRVERQIRTSVELTLDSSVPVAAPCASLPTEPKFSDAFVEAVAWYWTKGHDRKPGVGRTETTGAYIVQSNRVNSTNVLRIRACLTELFGPPVDRLPGVKGVGPAWREVVWPSAPDKTEFRLNAAAARLLREVAPDRTPMVGWLSQLTQAQLDLFIERSIDADGQRTKRGVGFAQKDRARADVFLAACLMAGRSASLRRVGRCEMWHVSVNTVARRKPLRQESVEWVEYDGIVWCPTTPNGTWLARRRGTTYFTGNSGSGGAGGDHNPGGLKEEQRKYAGTAAAKRKHPDAWPGAKSLCMIPEAFRLGLAYGKNPLCFDGPSGCTEHEKWLVRNVVRLCQRNPKPGRQGDKFWPATTDLVVACKSSERYWYEDMPNPSLVEHARRGASAPSYPKDWWVYKNRGTPGHPASWPHEIITPLVLAMTPSNGVVLDPFAGAGMSVRCASDHGRMGIGIDLSEEFYALAVENIGMYLRRGTPDEIAVALKERKQRFG
jgi:DNA modification methylase